MGGFFGCNYINRIFLSIVFVTFTLTYVVPLPAGVNFDLGDAAFMVRMEKLVEKLVKSKKKDADSMIGYLVKIKKEIEAKYQTVLNLDYYIGLVGEEIQKKSGRCPEKELEVIRKRIEGKENGHKPKRGHAAEHGSDEDKEEVPALLVYGVTCALCGFFLMALPFPVCKDWGGRMVVAGVTACANSLCSKMDENKK